VRALLAQIDLPSLGREGPEGLQRLLRAFFVLFAVGFLIGALGHLFRSRALRAVGIALIMLGSVGLLVAVGTYD
jgi:hypothetical protein